MNGRNVSDELTQQIYVRELETVLRWAEAQLKTKLSTAQVLTPVERELLNRIDRLNEM